MEKEQLKEEFIKRVFRISNDKIAKTLGVDTFERAVERASWNFVKEFLGYKDIDEVWQDVLQLQNKRS